MTAVRRPDRHRRGHASRNPGQGPVASVSGHGWSSTALFTRVWPAPRDRRPVVLLHGLVVSGSHLVPTGERLGQDQAVYAPDLPGFGGTRKPARALSIPELGEAVIGWWEAVGLGPGSLVASSVGCQIACEVAMRRPHLVDRLVLVSPVIDPAVRTLGCQVALWIRETRTQSAALKRLVVHDYAVAGFRRAFETLRYALWYPIEETLPFVPQPTLVVRGTDDPHVSASWADDVVDLLPDARLAVLAGAPHAMNFDAPGALVSAIRPFLAKPRP